MTPRHHPTPDEVLAILMDQYRHQSEVDPEAEPDAILTFDSSIADWREACDLLGWRGLGQGLNEEWGMSLSAAQWQDLLEPSRQRTLRTVCEVISREARIEGFPAAGLLGCPSLESRAFRAVREVLLRLGLPRKEIRTNTPVALVLARYGSEFLSPCVRLAPGALPPLKHVGRTHQALLVLMLALFLASLVLNLFKSPLGTWSLCLALVTMLLPWVPHPLFRGSLVLPGISTLADLATCLARGMSGEQGAPPNGGSAERFGSSDVGGQPPSVS